MINHPGPLIDSSHLHSLDALRAFALPPGVAPHATMARLPCHTLGGPISSLSLASRNFSRAALKDIGCVECIITLIRTGLRSRTGTLNPGISSVENSTVSGRRGLAKGVYS